jgi:hypothetical protein
VQLRLEAATGGVGFFRMMLICMTHPCFGEGIERATGRSGIGLGLRLEPAPRGPGIASLSRSSDRGGTLALCQRAGRAIR